MHYLYVLLKYQVLTLYLLIHNTEMILLHFCNINARIKAIDTSKIIVSKKNN